MAVVTGNVTRTCSRMDRFGYRDALHAVYASSAVLGGSAAACQPFPDSAQAAMTCQCQPQSLRHAQCFVFALTLPRRELADHH